MHIVLITGIYPPDLGGPATYSFNVASTLQHLGHTVEVITYGKSIQQSHWPVHYVSWSRFFFLRYWQMSRVIQNKAKNADIIYSFGTVSEGIPLLLARAIKPKKILRLGGDFIWERYTDLGGAKSLRAFYVQPPFAWRPLQWLYKKLLLQYSHIVFSTEWQQGIYLNNKFNIPPSSIIENAIQITAKPVLHTLHSPVKLLSMGRLVKFKQINHLIEAMVLLPNCSLTIIGEGPELSFLRVLVQKKNLHDRVWFIESVHGDVKQQIFTDHDLLVIPSLTDISPNTALEAVACGLPVLITKETGLSEILLHSMTVVDVSNPVAIAEAVESCIQNYPAIVAHASTAIATRSWEQVVEEHIELFKNLLPSNNA